MIVSRIVAVLLVGGAVAWIGSGVMNKAEHENATGNAVAKAVEAPKKRFQVGVVKAKLETHARAITFAGRTEADKRANAIARSSGLIDTLNVRRGTLVKAGDVIAILSDDARAAQVDQASARLEQRRTELSAKLKLIERGITPTLERPQLEAELRSAEAALAMAQFERRKASVIAPIAGVVNAVPVEQGQALQPGAEVAEIIALDPMLAVFEVAERQLAGLKLGDAATVRLITGQSAEGKVRFISRSAMAQTRTYRVDVELANPDGAIADGISCDVRLHLAPAQAAQIPRSALTFSAEGRLGVRTAASDGTVAFVPVTVVEDGGEKVWLSGVAEDDAVVIQGQDFIKEGEIVEAVVMDGTKS